VRNADILVRHLECGDQSPLWYAASVATSRGLQSGNKLPHSKKLRGDEVSTTRVSGWITDSTSPLTRETLMTYYYSVNKLRDRNVSRRRRPNQVSAE
jgi:hypothetical protein